MEVEMTLHEMVPLPHAAVVVLAEIKAAVEGFDRGDENAHDAVAAVAAAVDAYREAAMPRRKAS
jgi:hypothetical protein